jgi:hypothetical protein
MFLMAFFAEDAVLLLQDERALTLFFTHRNREKSK